MYIDVTKVPDNGYIFAYLRDCVIFEAYVRDGEKLRFRGSDKLDLSTMTECHCFDEKREYRLLLTGRGAHKRRIELVLSEDDEKPSPTMLYKEERMLLKREYDPAVSEHSVNEHGLKEEKRSVLRVINHYAYTEHDNIYVVNYRFAGLI